METRSQRSIQLPVFAQVLAAFIFALGAVLAAGGVYLLALGGSPFYVFQGIGLLVAGLYLFRGQSTGAIVYAAVFVAIIIWSFYEADGSVWALLPRLFGPAILMALVVLVAPRLEQPLFGPGVAVVVVLGLLPAGASTVLF